MDLSNGFPSQLFQVFIGELPLHFPPPCLGHHRVMAVGGSGTAASLLLGDLVRQQAIAYHQVALRDVEAFFSHAGGDQEVDDTLTEFVDRVRLLVLRGKHERTESREIKRPLQMSRD